MGNVAKLSGSVDLQLDAGVSVPKGLSAVDSPPETGKQLLSHAGIGGTDALRGLS